MRQRFWNFVLSLIGIVIAGVSGLVNGKHGYVISAEIALPLLLFFGLLEYLSFVRRRKK